MESIQHYIQEGILYKPIIPNIHDWPIAKLFKRKGNFVNEVIAESIKSLEAGAKNDGNTLQDLIVQTMYMERIRIYDDPYKIDPPDERKFWSAIKSELVKNEQLEEDPEALMASNYQMLHDIVYRYSTEIASAFKPQSYHFAKRFLPFMFSTLLNASAGKTIASTVNHRVKLQERVHLEGEIESIRELAQVGTVILVPTHFSNLDSIIVGWSLHAMGLPAFIYGAGLNLYNHAIPAFFMRRLGAYKVDRRKRNPIYRETLNTYSRRAIQNGVHSLFFPGGTRSRSGVIEKKLKLGLLGTAMDAQRNNFSDNRTGRGEKIFIVPVVIGYHFVLEAKSLINQHLTRTGKEQYYLLNDEFGSSRKFLEFLWKTFSAKSDISISLGKPMDMLGNFVDNAGVSYDSKGNPVDIKGYFMSRGELNDDPQRDREYTRLLGEKIVDRYHIENRVFASHVVAFVAFQLLKKKSPTMDLFGLLRLPEEERSIPKVEYYEAMERILKGLYLLKDQGKINFANHMSNDLEGLVNFGVKHLGLYHAKRPLMLKGDFLMTKSMNLLYYYHNRLVGYELERYI